MPEAPHRQLFRDYPLDGALLRFHPESGTSIRIENAETRHLQRVAPRVAMFGITNKCNLSCDFCSRDVQRESAWTVDSAAQVLQDLSAAGVLEVAFGGGEPFVFRGFADLVQQLHETTPLALNVTTNGLQIRPGSFVAYAGRLGQVRISLYDDPRWRDTAQVLSSYGQRWGANLLVDAAVLTMLPSLLGELAALGCHDVSLLSYIGADMRRHLTAEGRLQLAAMVQDAPLPCRLSVCFGDTVPLPRLFDGADGSGDCGAGVDFVSITPDQRMQGCSFHDGGLPARNAQEILAGWQHQRSRLAQPSLRHGCAGRKRAGVPQTQRAHAAAPSIRVWQAFSGNNSGECVMVAKFDTISDANSYLAQLLPAWRPEADYAPEWQQLFQAQAVAGPGLAYGEMPRDLLAIGRSVLAMGYGLEDQFPELRALAWKQGAASMSGGIHSHEVTLLAAVRTAGAAEALKLAAVEWADEFQARPFVYGDTLLLAMGLMGQEGELEACKRKLESLADGRPLAVEVHSDIVSSENMLEVMKRLGAQIHQTPRLVLQFWDGDPAVAQKKAAHFAQMVTEAEVTVAADCVLISGLSRRKRLAVLAYRQGATVGALDTAELQVSARLVLPELPRQKGKRAMQPPIDIELLQDELRLSLWPGEQLQVAQGYRGAAQVRVTSTQPERVLETLKQAAQRLGATTHFWVSEPQALAMAVRRLLAEVRE
ncbi:radical SAM protein [uncultured Comamonas sp.]|uniref:radical SAM protein n=1 Tax=uncultured Comamonas sp. TaxID=114710 RepID=UPI0025CBCD65|nr:radical SAM protein [uncultured Comamonas sp.]